MKNRAKKIIAIWLLFSTIFTCSIPVYAGKEYFAFTTNAVDKRTAPGKKSDLEQAAYVTTTYHSTNKSVAINVDNGSIYGVATGSWSFSSPTKAKKLGYMGYANMKDTFYIHYDPMGGVGTTIRGQYNP